MRIEPDDYLEAARFRIVDGHHLLQRRAIDWSDKMANTPLARIRKALEKEFSSKEIELKRTKGGSITGWITSDSFSNQSEIERMQRIFKILDEHLSAQDREYVSVVWPITKLERKVLIEDED